MRGDFSRIRFNPAKQYTAVVEQQGRVALDADANEQCAIDEYLREAEAIDAVGRYGAPVHDSGFKIAVQNNEISIGAGRYYVNGLLCENPASINYEAQPFLLGASSSGALLQQLAAAGSTDVIRVVLQVWQRLVTALDDPCLREPALGQADTTARVQTVSRVVASLVSTTIPFPNPFPVTPPLPAASTSPSCQAIYRVGSAPHNGTMAAQTSGAADACGCQPIPAAGYRGLENQLYRVEIHQSGTASTATFKWSRENGSVVVPIASVSGADVTVSSLGPDANLGFQVGQWVEISDDTNLFSDPPNQPGMLYQIKQIAGLVVTMTAPVNPVVNPARNARLCRWDQSGSAATTKGVALSSSWIDLENGIQVQFGGGQYTAGDYWLIPARAASGQIEWPPCGSNGQALQTPHFAEIHTAPLGCIHYTPASGSTPASFSVDDCRIPFSPLTELTPPAPPSALHVNWISWSNDDVMTLDALVGNGLTLALDQAPSSPITSANFVVELEAYPAISLVGPTETATTPNVTPAESIVPAGLSGPEGLSRPEGLSNIGHRIPDPIIFFTYTSTVRRTATLLDLSYAITPTNTPPAGSNAPAGSSFLSWDMPYGGDSSVTQNIEVVAIHALLLGGIAYGPGRVRVRLLGSTTFAGTGSNRVFLDGQSFGQTGSRADGTPRIDLQLPSGNSQKASDFESWFYLYPALTVASVLPAYSALTVANVRGVPTITASTPAGAKAQTVTVNLNYAAAIATTVNLTLTPPAGATTVATVPASMPVAIGQSSITVPVTLIGAPPVGSQSSYTLTVSIPNAMNLPFQGSAAFTITGGAAPGTG